MLTPENCKRRPSRGEVNGTFLGRDSTSSVIEVGVTSELTLEERVKYRTGRKGQILT